MNLARVAASAVVALGLGPVAPTPRAGKPPRPTSGPQLASAAPLVASLTPIAGAPEDALVDAWFDDTVIAHDEPLLARTDVPRPRVLVWTDLAKPPHVLAEVDGLVGKVVVSPKHDRVALLVVTPLEGNALGADNPGALLVVPLDGGSARTLVAKSDDFNVGNFSRPVWSPDGAALAVDVEARGGSRPRPTHARVYDATTGELLARTPANKAGFGPAPKRWEGDTLVLRAWTESGGDRILRWRPGDRPPLPARPDPTTLRSPDGRYTIAFHGATIEISGAGGRRRFVAKNEGDRAAVRWLREDPTRTKWLGSDALLLDADAPMALDLATAKLRYLLPDGELQFVTATADGQRVIARDSKLGLLWGRTGP
ncbi:MAG TPA: hypothetical protein VIF57_24965 [Polyangia bacterium]|jgi:hypothetical protein